MTTHCPTDHYETSQERPSRPPARLAPGLGARLGAGLIRIYQLYLSPLKPRTCRFYPSCSEYALRAVRHRGLLRGALLAAWRVLRCNPFSRGGYDPGPWAGDAHLEEQR
jgi:putative membrane protein insertion efficiency factor